MLRIFRYRVGLEVPSSRAAWLIWAVSRVVVQEAARGRR